MPVITPYLLGVDYGELTVVGLTRSSGSFVEGDSFLLTPLLDGLDYETVEEVTTAGPVTQTQINEVVLRQGVIVRVSCLKRRDRDLLAQIKARYYWAKVSWNEGSSTWGPGYFRVGPLRSSARRGGNTAQLEFRPINANVRMAYTAG